MMKSFFIFLFLTETAFSLTPEENVENARKFVSDVLEHNKKIENLEEHSGTEHKESNVIYVRTVNDNPVIYLSRPKISQTGHTPTPPVTNPHFIDENKESNVLSFHENKENEDQIAIIHEEVEERNASEEENPDKAISARHASRDEESEKREKVGGDYFTEYIIEDDIAYDNLIKRLGSYSQFNDNQVIKLEHSTPHTTPYTPLVEDRDVVNLNVAREYPDPKPEINTLNNTRSGDVAYVVNEIEVLPTVPEMFKPCPRPGLCKNLLYYKTYYQAMLNHLLWKYWNVVQGNHAVQNVLTEIRTMQNYVNYLNNVKNNYVYQPSYRRFPKSKGYRRG